MPSENEAYLFPWLFVVKIYSFLNSAPENEQASKLLRINTSTSKVPSNEREKLSDPGAVLGSHAVDKHELWHSYFGTDGDEIKPLFAAATLSTVWCLSMPQRFSNLSSR